MTNVDMARRYIELIDQLGEELGYGRGWKRRVAEQLGCSESLVGKIHKGERRSVGRDVIERSVGRMGLDWSFFVRPGGHYRDFLLSERSAPDGYDDFMAMAPADLEADEAAWLRREGHAQRFNRPDQYFTALLDRRRELRAPSAEG